jgi:hypothetical protein
MPLGLESSSVQRAFVRCAVEAGWEALFASLLHHLLIGQVRLPEFGKALSDQCRPEVNTIFPL